MVFMVNRLKKFKYLALMALLQAIYWLPDDIIIYRERLFGSIKNLSDYRFAYTVANWSAVFLALCLGILIAYKAGFYQRIKSTFTWQNLLVLGMTLILSLIISWLVNVIYLKYFSYMTLKNAQVLGWYYRLSPKGLFGFRTLVSAPVFEEMIFRACIFKFFGKQRKIALVVSTFVFAWIHTGVTPAIAIYLPFSLILSAIYYRTDRLSDTMLLHSGYNLLMNISAFYWLSHWTGFGG